MVNDNTVSSFKKLFKAFFYEYVINTVWQTQLISSQFKNNSHITEGKE